MEVVNEVRLSSKASLDGLQISSADFLDELNGRSVCSRCGKSRKYFCYTCYVAVDDIVDRIPNVKLPIKVEIIKHPGEVDGKSTASHAAVLAPEDVSVYTYPYIPDYEEKTKILLVFPGKDAKTLKQIADALNLEIAESESDLPTLANVDEKLAVVTQSTANLKMSPLSVQESKRRLKTRFPFEKIILIDSTWNQVRAIRKDERLKGISKLELVGRESLFWRFQRGKPRTYLSTIEAIYYILVDMHTLFIDSRYQGEYDNLLFFFKFMFRKINSIYQPDQLRVNRPLTEFPVKRTADANL